MEGDEGPLFPPKELQDEFDLLEEYQKDVLCNEANYYDETENEDEIEDNFDNLYEDEMDDEENESEPVDDTSGMLEDEYSVDDGAESTEEDEGIGLDEEEAGLKAREEEELANSIIDSIQTALPSSIQPDSTYPKLFVKNPGSLRMTDLGFRISQMVLLKQREGDVKMATHEDRDEPKDILLERHIQGKRKNKTV